MTDLIDLLTDDELLADEQAWDDFEACQAHPLGEPPAEEEGIPDDADPAAFDDDLPLFLDDYDD